MRERGSGKNLTGSVPSAAQEDCIGSKQDASQYKVWPQSGTFASLLCLVFLPLTVSRPGFAEVNVILTYMIPPLSALFEQADQLEAPKRLARKFQSRPDMRCVSDWSKRLLGVWSSSQWKVFCNPASCVSHATPKSALHTL